MPGSAYLADLEKDFEKTNPPAASADFINALPRDQSVRIEASSSVATDIARVDGKLHIFFANFDGLVAGQNAVQTPQKGIRVSLPAGGSRQGAGSCLSWARRWNSTASARTARSCSCCRTFRRARSCGSSRWLLGAVAQLLEPEPRADLYLPLRERRVGDGPGRLAIVDVVVG